jgi:predicted site-specific integrase-resolvase
MRISSEWSACYRYETELVEDILSLMASFSAKIYGKRSSQNRKKKEKEEVNA